MIKIVVTTTDYGAAAHGFGDPVRVSEIIEIPTKSIPPNLKKHLDLIDNGYSTISFSLLREEI